MLYQKLHLLNWKSIKKEKFDVMTIFLSTNIISNNEILISVVCIKTASIDLAMNWIEWNDHFFTLRQQELLRFEWKCARVKFFASCVYCNSIVGFWGMTNWELLVIGFDWLKMLFFVDPRGF